MRRLLTLLAVVDMNCDGPPISTTADEETSSAGGIPEVEAALLFLPKDSFHFDGFLVGADGVEGAGNGGRTRGAESKAEGIANMDTGSNGS